ncbi:MAG: VTT domain-containing protein [Candidatus Omnitrophica bacterium]|nr:VTT domain-containing protein [Candidatus Omnitrophota bacterium]
MQGQLLGMITGCKDLGVFLAMFLESSIVPVPSEAIIVGAAAIGVPVKSILIFGSLGSTVGAMVGYALGRYAAMPTILKFGKYVLIKPHHIYKAEGFAKKYGVWGVLLGRVLPIIPFKVFSIASGITKVPFVPFVICTAIGVVPRIFLLALFGDSLIKYTKPTVLILLLLVVVFLAFKITRMVYSGKKARYTPR